MIPNKNGRIYPPYVLKKAVKEYMKILDRIHIMKNRKEKLEKIKNNIDGI